MFVVPEIDWPVPETPHTRAEKLLLRHLDERQQRDYRKNKAFNVLGSDGLRYRITSKKSFNVVGEDGTAYCAIPVVAVPGPDIMLGHKLWLQNDVQSFFATAYKGRDVAAVPRDYPPRRFTPSRPERVAIQTRRWYHTIGLPLPVVIWIMFAVMMVVLELCVILGVFRL
jgi:hypothetical protein